MSDETETPKRDDDGEEEVGGSWACQKCGQVNLADATKCSNTDCGAAKP